MSRKENKLWKCYTKYKDVFSLRDEIGMCPNIEVNIEVMDNLPFFNPALSCERGR